MQKPAYRIVAATLAFLPALALASVKGWPQIGDFWPGMSFDEARAAAPKLTWQEGLKAPYTKKLLSIFAENAVTLGGLAHAVELQPGYLANYRETFQHTQPVADAAECERLTLPVVTDLEKIVGSLAATPKYDSQPVTDTTYHELKEVGASSTLSFETNDDVAKRPRTGDPTWRLGIAQHNVKSTTIQLTSMYTRDEKNARACRITTIVDYAPDAVPTETLAFSPSMLIQQPSIALRHLSLEGVTLPKDPYEMSTDCNVSRQTGQLACSLEAKDASPGILSAAILRIRAMRLDPAKLDPDNPTLLKTTIPIVLTGSDKHAIDFTKTRRIKLQDVSWASRPTPEQLEAVYPQKLLAQGKTAHLTLACQVQTDGSLICADTNAKPPTEALALADYKAFVNAGEAIMSLYVSTPKLKSGADAAGSVIETPVSFKPED